MQLQRAANLRKQVVSSVTWIAGVQYAGQIASWTITILVLRYLDPDDYGLMAKVYVCLGFMMMLNELGMTAAIVQKKEIEAFEVEGVFGLVIISNLLMTGILYAGAPLLAAFFHDGRLVEIFRIMGIVFLLASAYAVPQALMIRKMDFRSKSLIDLTATIFSSLLILILAFYGYGVWSLVAGAISGQAVSAVGYNCAARSFHRPRLNFRGLKDLLAFGSYISGSRMLWYVCSNADLFIGGRLLNSRELGIYSIALNLSCIPLDKFTPILNQVAFSAYSFIQDEYRKIKDHFLKSVRLVSLVVFPVCWGFIAIAPEVVPLLGPQWKETVLPIQILSLIMPFRAVGTLFAPVLQGTGNPKVHFLNLAIMNAVLVPFFIVGIRWGITGLCLSWIFGFSVAFVVMSVRSLKAIGLSAAEFISALRPPLAAGGVMLIATFVARHEIWSVPPVITPFLVVIVGASAYMLSVFYMNRGVLSELALLFRKAAIKQPEFQA